MIGHISLRAFLVDALAKAMRSEIAARDAELDRILLHGDGVARPLGLMDAIEGRMPNRKPVRISVKRKRRRRK